MRAKALSLCGILLGALWPIVTAAQTETTVDPQRATAEAALTTHDPADAIVAADRLLAENPHDTAALITRAVALLELGDGAGAAASAIHAYRTATNNDDRLQAARIAGGGYFRAAQYTRAEWWLRRAANHTRTPTEQEKVATEFRAIRDKNPLSLQLGLSVAPSSNINGGAEDESLFLGEFELLLPPESLAISGIEYAGDVQLSYRLSQSGTHITNLGAYVYGRTYGLSRDAKRDVPDIKGSDFALTLAELSVTHQQLLFDGVGPTSVSGHIGRVDFAGNPLWDYRRIALGQEFALGPDAQVAFQAAFQDQKGRDPFQPDTSIINLTGLGAYRFGNGDVIRTTLALQQNRAELDDNTFTDTNLTGTYAFGKPVLGAELSLNAGIGRTRYDEFSLALFGREDRYATLGGTVVFNGLSYFGFSPSMTLTARRTKSNVDRFTSSEFIGRIGIQSSF